MSRPTRVQVDETALMHNVRQVRQQAPNSKIIAMVKANAYGCGLASVVPVLEGKVDAFGVACLEEALAVRALGARTECILFQGVFSLDEFKLVTDLNLQCVIHQSQQLQWLLNHPQPHPLRIWIKVNTGMHRLGFLPCEVPSILSALQECSWVHQDIGVMTHLACADEPNHHANEGQLRVYQELSLPNHFKKSISNSAAILSLPESHADYVRPGIMLYGVSPFSLRTGQELGLMPVMRFISAITAIHHYPASSAIGYGGTWKTTKPSIIAVVPVGYGDGYPRHIGANTHVWVNGYEAPIVGRVSMDMMTVDLTGCPQTKIGDQVELWGQHIPVESVARSAGTIAYELLCQISPRVRQGPISG